MVKLEHKAGPTIIRELALRLYPSPLESFREAISNAFDEGSKKVEIISSNNEILVEDWGEGIKDFEKFRMYGQDTKATVGGETIGEKGLGKLALLRLGQNVEFRTNNGEFGIDIIMTIEGFEPEYGAMSKYLDHKGTRIVIAKPDLVPPTDELGDYLKRVFGLRIASGREIILNGAKLESKVDPEEETLFRIKGGVDITGNLKQDKAGKGSVELYVKHVFIKSLFVDPERAFKGWVNCNALTPTTNRNDVLTDVEVYDNFLDNLREHVARRFPKKSEEQDRSEIQLANELTHMLKLYLKHMNITPKGPIPMGRGSESVNIGRRGATTKKRSNPPLRKPTIDEEKNLKEKLRTDKPILRTRRTEFGLNEILSPEGNEKEPLHFWEPNFLIYNTTNDLYKFAKKDKAQLGPKWLRLLPWLARTGVNMNPESKKWDKEKTNMEIDRAMRYYLTQKGEIK